MITIEIIQNFHERFLSNWKFLKFLNVYENRQADIFLENHPKRKLGSMVAVQYIFFLLQKLKTSQ